MEQRHPFQVESSARRLDGVGNKAHHKKKTNATNSDGNEEEMTSAAQLRVIINQFGMLELDLTDRKLRRVPDAVFTLTRLEVLRLSRNRLRMIPASISNLRRLRHLDIGNNDLEELPTTLGACVHLVELDANGNRLSSIPETLPSGLARHLRVLKLAGNRIETLPMDFGRLVLLRRLDLSSNRLHELPNSTGNLRDLTAFNLSDNGFEEFPISVCRLANLEVLVLSRNHLSALPEDFCRLRRLRELRLASNRFDSVPVSICRVVNLAILDMADNTLTSLPVGLAALQRLTELDVRRNAIDRFPEVSSGWQCLERLNVSGNRLRVLPVGTMTRLRRLDADRNWLTEVPQAIHRLALTLESLSLAGNRITHLSADVALLNRLRVLDVSENALQSIPKVVEEMPGLETLDITGNNLMHHHRHHDEGKVPINGRRHLDGQTKSYVLDGLSGPPPQVGVPILFAQTPSGLLYAAPATTVPLQGRTRGHYGVKKTPPSVSSSPSPSGRKSSSGGVMRLFRSKNKNASGGKRNGSNEDGSSGDQKMIGMNAGTQTASNGEAVNAFPLFTSSRSDMLSSTSMSVLTGSVITNDLDHRPVKDMHIGNGMAANIATSGRGGKAVDNSGRSLSTDNLRNLGFAGPAEYQLPPDTWQPWRSATDLVADGEEKLGNHRSGDPDDDDDDGRISDTVTVNEEIGDELSLGEDDFEFMPENFHDTKLLKIAGDLETMLTKQLLDPIIDGSQEGGGGRQEKRTKMMEEPKSGRYTAKKNDYQMDTLNSGWNFLADTEVDTGKRQQTSIEYDDSFSHKGLQNAARNTRPLRRLVPPPPEVVPDTAAAAALSVETADTFQVSRSGGLFRSTTNPDVSVYIPSEALSEAITIQMQVISIAAEILNEPTVVAIGDIVMLRDVTAGDVTERRFRHHVTVTVPTPRAVVDMGGLGTAGKLHVLTYRSAGLDTPSRTLPSTCLPCAYDYTLTRRGILSIRAWHLAGLGAVLTKGANSFAACQSVENILRRLNSYRTSLVTSAAV